MACQKLAVNAAWTHSNKIFLRKKGKQMKKKRMVRLMSALIAAAMAVCMAGCSGSKEIAAEDKQQTSDDASLLADVEDLDEAYWKGLPFGDVLPMDAGEIKVDGKDEIVIGFSQTGFNHPWRSEMINSAQAEVNRYPNVRMIVTDGNVDIVDQSGDMRDLINQGVDAIVISPVESDGLVAAVEEAYEAGIPVIVLDRDIYTDQRTLFIGQSNVTMGAAVAQAMVDDLTEKYGKPEGKILEITGLVGSSPAIDRQAGMESVLKDYPDIEILATGDGEWIRDPAVALMEDWLVAYDEIDAVYSHAEESSWGAQLAIERAGRQNEGIMHYTMDGSNEGFVDVKDGVFMADGNYSPFIGQLGIRAALYTLTGKEIAGLEDYEYGKKLVLPDSPVVRAENAEEWIGKGWGDY